MASSFSSSFDAFFEKVKPYAPAVARIAIALVFLWFGINQLLIPKDFMGYLPGWVIQDTIGFGHYFHSIIMLLHLTPAMVLFLNGLLETVLGILLLIGLFTRASALILGLHLLSIAFSLGYNDVAIRDLGLILVTISVFLHGPDRWCWDSKRDKYTHKENPAEA